MASLWPPLDLATLPRAPLTLAAPRHSCKKQNKCTGSIFGPKITTKIRDRGPNSINEFEMSLLLDL